MYLFVSTDSYQILYELVQNLKANSPRVKIEDLNKSNSTSSDYREQVERLPCKRSGKSNNIPEVRYI